MGCDAYADENGKFELHIIDYNNGKILRVVEIEDLEERHPILIEIICGLER